MNKVIFFDLYQTLLDVEISSSDPAEKLRQELVGWEALVEELKKYQIVVSAEKFLALYEKKRSAFYANNRDEKIHHHNMATIIADILSEYFHQTFSSAETQDLIYAYRKASRGWLRLYPGVRETLTQFSKEYVLSTASHTQASFTQLELRELGIENLFFHFVYTSDIGFRKESPEFYKRALEIVGREARDCIMVGDNYDVDVIVPQEVGIRAIWVKNPITASRYPMEKEPLNTLQIEHFRELPVLIRKI